MAAGNFELYVSKEKFEGELQQLDAKLGSLNGLLAEYEAKRQQAAQVWGDQDENLAKAQALCDAAIKAVQKKIDETKTSKDALQSILSDAQTIQADMGSQLDEARATIESLLK